MTVNVPSLKIISVNTTIGDTDFLHAMRPWFESNMSVKASRRKIRFDAVDRPAKPSLSSLEFHSIRHLGFQSDFSWCTSKDVSETRWYMKKDGRQLGRI
jgi:hypothetical protein